MKMTYKEIYEKLLSLTLSFIAHKSRSEHEVSGKIDKLLVKSEEWYPHLFETVDTASSLKEDILEMLSKMNVINDKDYAKTFVMQKIKARKSVSRLEISNFLFKKGISKEISDNALLAYTQDIERKNIKKELIKRSSKSREKLIKYLLGRGFKSSLVFELVNLED